MTISPYAKPGFYDDALSKGRHRDIVGGRWGETADIVMPLLMELGLRDSDKVLDIGAGSLRLGHRLMRRGWEVELTDADRAKLPVEQLVEDAEFRFPAVPDDIDFALCFAVFTHLPMNHLRRALVTVRHRFPTLRRFVFTVFLAPDPAAFAGPFRQNDGVVTHPDRAPWHMLAEDALHLARASGFQVAMRPDRLPRGQVMFVADPAR